jgi:ABC-2 type transport system permease protein
MKTTPDPEQSGSHRGPAAEWPWLLVARREMLIKLTDRSFLVGTLITLLMIGGFIGFQIWTEQRTQTWTVAVPPEAQSVAKLLEREVPGETSGSTLELVEVSSDKAGVQSLDDEADVLLRPAANGWTLVATSEVPFDLEAAATTIIRASVLATNTEAAGTSVTELLRGSEVDTELVDGNAEQRGFADSMGFALAFLFYIAALGFGFVLAGSVVEEKANRVVEIIATKIPVRQLLIGKIVGNSLLAIAQTALLVGVGLVGVSFTDYADFLPAVSQGVGWFVAFFAVGFSFIACWWAVAGALASRSEDLQSTTMPLTMLMVAVFFGSFLFEGAALEIASYIPPFSCVLMPTRVLRGDAALWEPFVAIAILVAAMGATVVLAERIYRRALLQTQGRVSLKQAWRTAE